MQTNYKLPTRVVLIYAKRGIRETVLNSLMLKGLGCVPEKYGKGKVVPVLN
jgi:hypothetical protein